MDKMMVQILRGGVIETPSLFLLVSSLPLITAHRQSLAELEQTFTIESLKNGAESGKIEYFVLTLVRL